MSDCLSLSIRHNPDGQPPLPMAAAVEYAQTVMDWAYFFEPPAHLTRFLNLPYAGSHRLQCLDVFAPANARHAPVLVFWHGGGWTHGYRQWGHFMAPHVTALGMVLVLPSYRLAPEHPLPDALEDALLALRYVQAHAHLWGGAAQQLFLAGHSAGGHLAAMTALRHTHWSQHGIEAQHIRACFPVSGILDLHHPHPLPGSLEEAVYTKVLCGLDPELDKVLSPVSWASQNVVPMHLTYGEHDSERVQMSNQRCYALLGAQAPSSLTQEKALNHFQTHLALNCPSHAWYERLRRAVALTVDAH